MRKKTWKKDFSSKPPKAFRQEEDFHRDARSDEKKPSGKKFFSPKKRGDDFESTRFSKEENRGFGRGKKQYRESSKDDRQQPKPLYSTGGKKKFFRDEQSRPFRGKKGGNHRGDAKPFSREENFNSEFSGRKNDTDGFRDGNSRGREKNFRGDKEFKKQKPFFRFEKEEDQRRADAKPFREKKDFFQKPSYRGNDEGKHRAGRGYTDGRGGASKSFEKGKRFNSGFPRRDDTRPFRGQRGFDAKFSGKKPFRKVKGKRTTKTDTAQMLNEPVRLNKYLAHAGIASRRESDELIKAGYVTVNGQVVLEMGHKVQPGDVVKFKNQIISPEKKVYILLNKPKDYITTVTDDRGRPTVMDLIQNATDMRIYPVGRLDRNTTGLLLLTNDGELAQKLTHPSFEAKKVYQATLDKPLAKEDMKRIADGVQLEEGVALVDAVEYADPRDKRKIGIELHIGWNKVVRRIFEQLSYKVIQLDRVYYAGLIKDVPRGKWRMLAPKEVIMLKHFA